MFRYYSPTGTYCTPAVAPMCSRPAAAMHDTHTCRLPVCEFMLVAGKQKVPKRKCRTQVVTDGKLHEIHARMETST